MTNDQLPITRAKPANGGRRKMTNVK
jgi:hypothetical protein